MSLKAQISIQGGNPRTSSFIEPKLDMGLPIFLDLFINGI